MPRRAKSPRETVRERRPDPTKVTEVSPGSLADDMAAGNHAPTLLDQCDSLFTLDRNPHVVRLIEFTLFAESPQPAFREPHYLVLQPQRLLPPKTATALKAEMQNAVYLMANEWGSELPTATLPDPNQSDIDVIREAIRRVTATAVPVATHTWHTTGGDLPVATVGDAFTLDFDGLPSLDSPAKKLRTDYGNWLNKERNRILGLRFQSLVDVLTGGAEPGLAGRLTSVDDFVSSVVQTVLPSQFQPIKYAHPLLALCATFDQVWEPRGYTRGELISTLSLAPGERLTLEVHSWDKSSRRSEEDIATELEIRSSEKMTQRDALTVTQEFARQRSTKVDASGKVPIPKMPVGVSVGVSVETRNSLSRSRESTQEQIVEASNTLKVNRKTRIEVSRETGREEKQTRVVENTNRCHSLNCHYFEVMSNYVVTTRLVSIRPCVLLLNERRPVTIEWVLCHEGILIESLLDRTVLPGFDAAKTLKTAAVMADLQLQVRVAGPEPLGEQVSSYSTAIANAYRALSAARQTAMEAKPHCYMSFDSELARSACIASRISDTDMARIVTLAGLEDAPRHALESLVAGVGAGQDAGQLLRAFFTAVTPAAFARISDERFARMMGYGFSSTVLFYWLQKDPLTLDDAGLRAAVADAAAAVTSAGEAGTSANQEVSPSEVERFSYRELAGAHVEFGRLSCHLEENWLHYTQAVWVREGHGERLLRLLKEQGPVASAIENELLGFYADRAAYPLRDPSLFGDANLQDMVERIDELIEQVEATPNPPTLITLPTPGVILEAMVGRCSACEEFIEQSRVIELRQQRAKARQEEAEAARREGRLTAIPPDLSDPSPRTPTEIAVKLRTTGGENDGET